MVVHMAASTRVVDMVSYSLMSRQEVRKYTYLVFRCEHVEGSMYGYQFCPHDGTAFFCSRHNYVDGGVSGNV